MSISPEKLKVALALLLLGNLCFAISHIMVLPPWEGFDEIAHYSSIQQIADTGSIPRQKRDRVSTDVEAYYQKAPMPYSTNPPMEQNRGITYKLFFESSVGDISEGRDMVHGSPENTRYYRPGAEPNWQSQHPPLLYTLLSPVYLWTKSWSWSNQLAALRLACYSFVWLAMIVGVYCCSTHFSRKEGELQFWTALGIGVWPILFLSWFPSMARLGNDSLCTLIVALVWLCIALSIKKEKYPLRQSIILGVLLGLGCLTKAFFAPITAGTLLFWCFLVFRSQSKRDYGEVANHAAVIFVTVGVISGWWYILNWFQYGALLGSLEMILLNDQGGVWQGLQNHFSLEAWLRGHVVFIRTLAWVGTWSWVRPSNLILFPISLLPILAACCYLIAVKRYQTHSLCWLPVWWMIPILTGFSYHILVRVAYDGVGTGTSGYFLNMMIIPLGVALGLGMRVIWKNRIVKYGFTGLVLYGLGLGLYTTWSQLLLFAGIAFKAGQDRTYLFPDDLQQIWDASELFARLAVISNPEFFGLAFMLGICFTVAGILSSYLYANQISKTSI